MVFETTSDIFGGVPSSSLILVQTNVLGYGASGLLLKIAREYPDKMKEFREFCGWFKDYKKQEEIIGTTFNMRFEDKQDTANFGKIIACCFTLKWLTHSRNELRLDAWEKIAKKVAKQTAANFKATGTMYQVHIPAKIGSNLSEDEVKQVHEILDHVFKTEYPNVDLYYHSREQS